VQASKDRIDFWNRSLLAQQELSERNFGGTEVLLLDLVGEDPRLLLAVDNLGEVYLQQGKAESLG
jgi:hypothetical protein